MGAVFACLVMTMMAIAARAFKLPRMNAAFVFTAPWIAAAILGGILGGITDPISELTWAMILIAAFATLFGSIVGWGGGPRPQASISVGQPIDFLRLRRVHVLLLLLLCGQLALQLNELWPLVQEFGGLQAILDRQDDIFRNSSVDAALARSQSGLGSGGLAGGALNYLLFLFGMSSIYTGSLLWIARRRLLAALPVALVGLAGVVTLQRTSVVFALLLFFFGIMSMKWSSISIVNLPASAANRSSVFRAAASTLTIIAAAIGLLVVVTNARGQTGNEKGLLSLFAEYFVGGLAGLNARNLDGSTWAALPSLDGGYDPSPGLGGYTFTGLWSVLARLGIPLEQTRYNLDFTPVTLFGEPTYTNVAGAVGEYYLDFRWLGIIVLPLVIGLFTSALQARSFNTQKLTYAPALSYLLALGSWSFFASWFSDFRQTLLAIFAGPLLVRLLQHSGRVAPATQASVPAASRTR